MLVRNITTCKKELLGHARRVGLVEWHPTAANILFSAGYDYKVGLWIHCLTQARRPCRLRKRILTRVLETRSPHSRSSELPSESPGRPGTCSILLLVAASLWPVPHFPLASPCLFWDFGPGRKDAYPCCVCLDQSDYV